MERSMKLKEKLKNWLFKEELNDIKETKEKYDELLKAVDKAYRMLGEAREMHDKSHALLTDCHKFMNSICDVGTDVGFRTSDHSWAVICIHGKKDYVKFVDMDQSDIRTIASFLKTFEYSNKVTDSPLHRGYIEDMIKQW
jgi:hypothetical protein